MRPGCARPARRIAAFRSGRGRACSKSSGGRDCSPTTRHTGSSGSGCRATGRWARRRWAASIRAPIPPTEPKRGKRSLLCEGRGAPLGIEIAGANTNDFRLLRATLENIVIHRPDVTPSRPQGLCLDKGYDYPEVYELVGEYRLTPHIRSRGEEKHLLERT